jgi:WD40 repeat protein
VTSGPVLTLAFSPDSRTLVTGSFLGGAQMWDVASREKRGPVLGHQGRVMTIAVSADGTMIATGGAVEATDPETGARRLNGGEVRLWQAATGQPITVLPHPHIVWSLAFSPQGRMLRTGSEDGAARCFLTATGMPMGPPLGHEGTVRAVAISPDGTAAVTASAGGDHNAAARLWQLPRERALGKALFRRGASIASLSTSPNGEFLAAGATDGTAQLWNSTTGQRFGPALVHSGEAVFVALSPDGRTLLAGGEKGSVTLWDGVTGRRFALSPPAEKWNTAGWISAVAFSADGRTFLAGWRNGLIKFFRTATGKPFGRPGQVKGMPVWSVTESPDGQRLVMGIDQGAQLWDKVARRRIAQCPKSMGILTRGVFYPDGKKVLLMNLNETQIWDLAANRVTGPPRFHPEKGIRDAAFNPDGRSVLVSSTDGFTRLWDVATGKPLGPPVNHAASGPVAIDAKGRMLIAGGKDGRITLWPAPQPLEGTVERVRLWVEVLTGAELDNQEVARTLKPEEVKERQRRLRELGGPLQALK